jgi:outer membrane protein assembly factor BamB
MRKISNAPIGKLLPIVLLAGLIFMVGGQSAVSQTLFGGKDASAEPIWTYDADWDVRHVETADLNGDNVPDVIAGEYNSTYYGDPSKVIAIDGSTGDTLWTYQLQDGVRSMTIADLTDDGVMDVIAGASYQGSPTPDGYVHAINGVDGSQLWTFYVGSTVSCLTVGNFNGDIYPDVASGDFDGFVYAIDGRVGTQLWSEEIGSLWINALDAADVNGDGTDDVAFAHEYLAGYSNYIGVLDGTDGSSIWTLTVAHVNMDVMIEDIDSDDTLEAVFGVIYNDNHGEIQVRTAETGDVEWSFNLGSVDHTNGEVLVASYDLDEDTDPDLVVSTYLGNHVVYAFEGDVNTPIWTSDTLDGNSRDIAFGDVTGEKDIDIVLATSDRVQVINGQDGSKIWYYAVGGNIQSVSCADFDEDEILDVAAGGGAGYSGSDPATSVWALRTVQSPLLWEHTFGEYGNAIAIADLNGDGAEDVVSVSSLDDYARAINGADGTELWTWQGTENLYAVCAGDFDNDEQIDVAVAGADDQVTALYGDSGNVMWTFPTGDQIYRKCLQAADLNDDGNVDVIAGCNDNYVYALSGTERDPIWSTNVGADVNDLRIAQMDGLGPPDVVVAVGGGTSGAKVTVLDGTDGGVLWEYFASESIEHIEVCDVNEDDVPDVAAAQTPFGTKQIIMIDGVTHGVLWTHPVNLPSNTHSISQGDLNFDKIPEIIAMGGSTDKKVYALNGIDGGELWSFETGGEINTVLAYDVDNDDSVEVVAGSDDQIMYVIKGTDGSEEFNYSTAGDVMQVQIGDINGDGLPNIACITFDSDGIVYAFKSLATGPVYMCGDINGDTTINIFDATSLISFLYMEGDPPVSMNEADVNNDGTVNIFDVVYIISFLYLEGPPPDCP